MVESVLWACFGVGLALGLAAQIASARNLERADQLLPQAVDKISKGRERHRAAIEDTADRLRRTFRRISLRVLLLFVVALGVELLFWWIVVGGLKGAPAGALVLAGGGGFIAGIAIAWLWQTQCCSGRRL